MSDDGQRRFGPGEAQAVWVLWLTYGAFYFCRTNISAAVPGIEAELELTKTQIGLILGGLKLAYGVGQLINGQVAERVSARRLLAIGMLASALLNVVFGLGTGLYFLLFVWAANGYVQSLGWPPTMRVAASWFPVARRGRAIGIIGTGYQLTGALTFVIAGWSAEWLGWRGALYVPAALLAAAAVHMLVFLRDAPPDADGAPGRGPRREHGDGAPWVSIVVSTLSNPRLWLLALSLGLLNACRYGFLDWGVAHLGEVQGSGVGVSALKYSVLPFGGIVGSLVAGWMTDRFFGGRRIPVICGMLGALFLLTIGYDAVVRTNVAASVTALAVIGALIFGPQVLLVGTTPIDLARRGTPASAVGFVNFGGYLGAFAGDQLTGYLVDHYDWHTAIYFWAGCALAAAVVVAPLWRAVGRRDGE
jgi:sugar phosphate permease